MKFSGKCRMAKPQHSCRMCLVKVSKMKPDEVSRWDQCPVPLGGRVQGSSHMPLFQWKVSVWGPDPSEILMSISPVGSEAHTPSPHLPRQP